MFLKQSVHAAQEIKKSRFLVELVRVQSAQEAVLKLAAVKKEHPQATHVCSAWKIGPISHANDDGEPAGTAGRPMLDVLEGSGGDQIMALVIRYFGGTLLGKGGLVRAYSSSVALALEQAQWVIPRQAALYEALVPYEIAGKVEAYLRTLPLEQFEAAYGHMASYTFISEEDPTESLASRFSGQVQIRLLNTCTLEN